MTEEQYINLFQFLDKQLNYFSSDVSYTLKESIRNECGKRHNYQSYITWDLNDFKKIEINKSNLSMNLYFGNDCITKKYDGNLFSAGGGMYYVTNSTPWIITTGTTSSFTVAPTINGVTPTVSVSIP